MREHICEMFPYCCTDVGREGREIRLKNILLSFSHSVLQTKPFRLKLQFRKKLNNMQLRDPKTKSISMIFTELTKSELKALLKQLLIAEPRYSCDSFVDRQ